MDKIQAVNALFAWQWCTHIVHTVHLPFRCVYIVLDYQEMYTRKIEKAKWPENYFLEMDVIVYAGKITDFIFRPRFSVTDIVADAATFFAASVYFIEKAVLYSVYVLMLAKHKSMCAKRRFTFLNRQQQHYHNDMNSLRFIII